MKAMILAAGKGERLLPLTLTKAKPALPVFNVPIIVHTLNFLYKYGIEEVFINLHYKPESIKYAIDESFDKEMKITFSLERKLLGTAGGLKKVERYFSDETFVVINSDTLLNFDLKEMIVFHKKNNADSTMLLAYPNKDDSFGKVYLSDDMQVVDILELVGAEKKCNPMNFTGVHILEPSVFDYIPKEEVKEINSDIYPKLIKDKKKILGFVNRGYWCDVGTLKRYREIQTEVGDNIAANFNIEKDKNGCLIGNNTIIDESAEVFNSVIGKNCRIEGGCKIRNCVILDNVVIKRNTLLEKAIVCCFDGKLQIIDC
ncbi:MAG: NDP-sugar synthase [Candidatus Schekmanbacteria bacterium]|nr:MAG: NDP-sugar synthase [Candidatus Schekmanbacteria bacterium]